MIPARVSPALRRKLAFLACGALGFALYVLASALLLAATPMAPQAAAVGGVLVAIPPTFWLQKRVAFRHDGAAGPAFAKYCGLQALNALAIAAIAAAGHAAGLPDLLNVVVSGALVTVLSWLVLSGYVFRGATP